MTRKEFDSLYLYKAVHCDTEEKANEFLTLADSVGYRWRLGESLIEENEWEMYKKETCYEVADYGFSYANINELNPRDYQIIEYVPQSKFKVGDKVRVNNNMFTNLNGKVGVVVEVDASSLMTYSVKVGYDEWTLWFYENQLEKVEESPQKEETIDDIIEEIKTKWSEINLLLNQLEKKKKEE